MLLLFSPHRTHTQFAVLLLVAMVVAVAAAGPSPVAQPRAIPIAAPAANPQYLTYGYYKRIPLWLKTFPYDQLDWISFWQMSPMDRTFPELLLFKKKLLLLTIFPQYEEIVIKSVNNVLINPLFHFM